MPTISEWLHILETTSQIIIVPPYFENLGKRLIKSPKVYWGDLGLACYLLGITSEAELRRSPFLGQLFEGFVATEILKSQVNQGCSQLRLHGLLLAEWKRLIWNDSSRNKCNSGISSFWVQDWVQLER